MKQKCVITIEGMDEEDSVKFSVKWTPALDVNNEKNNHAGVVFAAIAAINGLRKKSGVVD